MDRMSGEVVECLDKLLKHMEKRIGVDRIDYEKEEVIVYYIFNYGESDEWVNHDALHINTSMESVPCMIWEVVNAAYKRFVC